MSSAPSWNRRTFVQSLATGAVALATPHCLSSAARSPAKRNVLFIAVDDLRPQLGCYGQHQMISPNIDRLAGEGLLFERAYCQQPICMASRASLLSGYRPEHNRIYTCGSLHTLVPDALTLNQHFSQNGYEIWASGKIYHHAEDHQHQFGDRWQNPDGNWMGRGYLTPEAIVAVRENESRHSSDPAAAGGRGPAFEAAEVEDNAYEDGAMTDLALSQLERLAHETKPFWMALGFHKPHLPFNAPAKYWRLYDSQRIRLADNPFLPQNATEFTRFNFSELRNYVGIPQGTQPLPDDLALQLVHGYYACVAYIDAQIGRLLQALDRLKLRDKTVIVLWGDHGWKLGEHGLWGKHTPFEWDCRAPLIISAPHLAAAGQRTRALVEFVDIYPTLCDLCGLPKPDHLQGDSLIPLWQNPSRPWKRAAFTQWPKKDRDDPDKLITGYAIKTDRFRYVEWTHVKTRDILARELYDHETDPAENINLASLAEHQTLVQSLSRMLNHGEGWRTLRPQP